MNLTLTRRSIGPVASEGLVVIEGRKFYTIEQPWADNKPGHSCVPAGDYRLVPVTTPKHGKTHFMVNPELGIYADEGQGRFACIFAHTGNWSSDVEGCVAIGLSSGKSKNPHSGVLESAVFNSKAAVAALREVLPWVGHSLTIVND